MITLEGVSIKTKLSQKSGFTIIEIMVVMAIMAVMSVLGILAMLTINNGVIADQVAENTLSQIREAQNKALSVASTTTTVDGVPTQTIPVAWGVTLTQGDDSVATITPFYIWNSKDPLDSDARDSFKQVNLNADTNTSSFGFKSIKGGDGSTYSTVSLIYAAPFGKYYASSSGIPCGSDGGLCISAGTRPYNLQLDSDNDISTNVLNFQLIFRGSTKTITVQASGEAGISE